MQRGEREGDLRLTASQEVRGTVANTSTYHSLSETVAVGGGGVSSDEVVASLLRPEHSKNCAALGNGKTSLLRRTTFLPVSMKLPYHVEV